MRRVLRWRRRARARGTDNGFCGIWNGIFICGGTCSAATTQHSVYVHKQKRKSKTTPFQSSIASGGGASCKAARRRPQKDRGVTGVFAAQSKRQPACEKHVPQYAMVQAYPGNHESLRQGLPWRTTLTVVRSVTVWCTWPCGLTYAATGPSRDMENSWSFDDSFVLQAEQRRSPLLWVVSMRASTSRSRCTHDGASRSC